MDQNERQPMNNFNRILGGLHGLPDIVSTKASVLRVVSPFGIGTHMYVVQSFRQREQGDTIFLEHVSENGTTRLVIPAAVADTISRQREMLNSKTRSKAMKIVAEERKAKGLKPGFMNKKKETA